MALKLQDSNIKSSQHPRAAIAAASAQANNFELATASNELATASNQMGAFELALGIAAGVIAIACSVALSKTLFAKKANTQSINKSEESEEPKQDSWAAKFAKTREGFNNYVERALADVDTSQIYPSL